MSTTAEPDHFLCPLDDLANLMKALLLQGKIVRLRVRGYSMPPAIRDGEVVWIAPLRPGDIVAGRVVLYLRENGRPIIHRVIRRGRRGGRQILYIGSDRFPGRGEWVSPERVYGRVVALERGGRRVRLDGWRGRLWGWVFLLLRPFRPLIARLRGHR